MICWPDLAEADLHATICQPDSSEADLHATISRPDSSEADLRATISRPIILFGIQFAVSQRKEEG